MNACNPKLIDKLVKQQSTQQYRRTSMRFAPEITSKLKSKFHSHGFEIVYRNKCKLMNLLGSTKDKTAMLKKSGIYEIECTKCNRKYYGQTKRNIETRMNDHKSYVRLNQPNKSAIASHIIFECQENVCMENVKLLEQVNDDKQLDAYEAHYIQRDPNALNSDKGNIESCLFSRV